MKKVYTMPLIRIHVIDGEELLDTFNGQSKTGVQVIQGDNDDPFEEGNNITLDNNSHANDKSWADDLEID